MSALLRVLFAAFDNAVLTVLREGPEPDQAERSFADRVQAHVQAAGINVHYASNLSASLRRLEAGGYVESFVVERAGERHRHWRLTEKGRAS